MSDTLTDSITQPSPSEPVSGYEQTDNSANETAVGTEQTGGASLDQAREEVGSIDQPSFLSDPFDSVFFDFVSSMLTGFFDFIENVAVGGILGIKPIETDGPLTFGEPETGFLMGQGAHMAWSRTWPGSGEADVAAAAVTILIALTMGGAILEMFRYNTSRTNGRKNLLEGIAFIIMWFPMALFFMQIVFGITLAVSPDMFTVLAGIATAGASAYVLGPITMLIALAGAAVWILVILLLQLQRIGILVYLTFGPLLIAGWYSNIPIISDYCKQILKKFVPLVFMPLPIAVVGAVISGLLSFRGSPRGMAIGAIAPVLVPALLLITGLLALFGMWSLFKASSKTASTLVGGVVKGGAAAGLLASGNVMAARGMMYGGPTRALAFGATGPITSC